jgi:hypothetical protein
MNDLNQDGQETKSKRKKGKRIRRFIMGIIAVIILFLAALFGNIFPGLNDLRDKVLQSEAYYDAAELIEKVKVPVSKNEILIEEDTIYYMDEEVTLEQLDAKTDEVDSTYMTVIDNYATQRTWDAVYSMLEEKGFAISEEIAR